jgi:hypothetical protein
VPESARTLAHIYLFLSCEELSSYLSESCMTGGALHPSIISNDTNDEEQAIALFVYRLNYSSIHHEEHTTFFLTTWSFVYSLEDDVPLRCFFFCYPIARNQQDGSNKIFISRGMGCLCIIIIVDEV